MLDDVSAPGSRIHILGQDQSVLGEVEAVEAIPFGHKVAIRSIEVGDDVIKFGAPIGAATQDIVPGQQVHVHNVRSARLGIETIGNAHDV